MSTGKSISKRLEETIMVKVALLVRLEAKTGKEDDVANFLRSGFALVEEEPATVAWFAIQLGPTSFGIFDADRPWRRVRRDRLQRL